MKRKWSEGRVYICASVNPSPATLHLFKGQASSNRAHPETCTEQLFICLFVLRKGIRIIRVVVTTMRTSLVAFLSFSLRILELSLHTALKSLASPHTAERGLDPSGAVCNTSGKWHDCRKQWSWMSAARKGSWESPPKSIRQKHRGPFGAEETISNMSQGHYCRVG